jgi:hypothetical protein
LPVARETRARCAPCASIGTNSDTCAQVSRTRPFARRIGCASRRRSRSFPAGVLGQGLPRCDQCAAQSQRPNRRHPMEVSERRTSIVTCPRRSPFSCGLIKSPIVTRTFSQLVSDATDEHTSDATRTCLETRVRGTVPVDRSVLLGRRVHRRQRRREHQVGRATCVDDCAGRTRVRRRPSLRSVRQEAESRCRSRVRRTRLSDKSSRQILVDAAERRAVELGAYRTGDSPCALHRVDEHCSTSPTSNRSSTTSSPSIFSSTISISK